MIQLTPHMKIFIALDYIDFRRGIDRLAAWCWTIFNEDPKSGGLFVFRNRKATAAKILFYDTSGFWLCQKRLSVGKFCGWPKASGDAETITAKELSVLLWGGDPDGVFRDPWRRIEPVTWNGKEHQKETRPDHSGSFSPDAEGP